VASMRVMERLGMTRSIEFDYPNHPEGSPLRRHVLYSLPRLAQYQIRPTNGMSAVRPKRS
jgi:RimJ/RimL family protein N-acetyltransferase